MYVADLLVFCMSVLRLHIFSLHGNENFVLDRVFMGPPGK